MNEYQVNKLYPPLIFKIFLTQNCLNISLNFQVFKFGHL